MYLFFSVEWPFMLTLCLSGMKRCETFWQTNTVRKRRCEEEKKIPTQIEVAHANFYQIAYSTEAKVPKNVEQRMQGKNGMKCWTKNEERKRWRAFRVGWLSVIFSSLIVRRRSLYFCSFAIIFFSTRLTSAITARLGVFHRFRYKYSSFYRYIVCFFFIGLRS